ncbi:MAG: sigma-70 family RNA polymerase sigma factor [Planctomycetes bacterium]|nr:sigma-70 family RNA polymerase sigma factor [Planctomycetota bacterium]
MFGRSTNHDRETDDDDTNLSLLNKTQAYLRIVLTAQVPDSFLVAAWSEFYRVYNELIRRAVAARGVLLRETDIEDCAQEVWMSVARHLVHFRHPKERPGLRAWLYRLVQTKTADVLRKRSRIPLAPTEVADASAVQSNARRAVDPWQMLLVETILDDMASRESPLDCRIFRMRVFDGCAFDEIAESLRITTPATRYRFGRMLRKVRDRIAVYTGSSLDRRSRRSVAG